MNNQLHPDHRAFRHSKRQRAFEALPPGQCVLIRSNSIWEPSLVIANANSPDSRPASSLLAAPKDRVRFRRRATDGDHRAVSLTKIHIFHTVGPLHQQHKTLRTDLSTKGAHCQRSCSDAFSDWFMLQIVVSQPLTEYSPRAVLEQRTNAAEAHRSSG